MKNNVFPAFGKIRTNNCQQGQETVAIKTLKNKLMKRKHQKYKNAKDNTNKSNFKNKNIRFICNN